MEEIKKIKTIRKNKKLTIRKLASSVGCSNGNISHLEKGDVTPSITILKNIQCFRHQACPFLFGRIR